MRVVVLSAGAGLALRGVWGGTTPLVVVAGVLAYVAALDAIEGLAQDADHPDRAESSPLPLGTLRLRHVPAATVVMVGGGLVATAAVAALGSPGRVITIGLAMAVPAALLTVCGAATSLVFGSPMSTQLAALTPEALGVAVLVRAIWPPTLAVLGMAPALAGRLAFEHDAPVLAAVVTADVAVLVVGTLALGWLRFGAEASAWWRGILERRRITAKP